MRLWTSTSSSSATGICRKKKRDYLLLVVGKYGFEWGLFDVKGIFRLKIPNFCPSFYVTICFYESKKGKTRNNHMYKKNGSWKGLNHTWSILYQLLGPWLTLCLSCWGLSCFRSPSPNFSLYKPHMILLF